MTLIDMWKTFPSNKYSSYRQKRNQYGAHNKAPLFLSHLVWPKSLGSKKNSQIRQAIMSIVRLESLHIMCGVTHYYSLKDITKVKFHMVYDNFGSSACILFCDMGFQNG